MDDIRKLAILLIYPDGTIDFVPKGEAQIHMPYFRELRKTSERFKNITEGLDFDINIHNHIDAFLANEGIILLYETLFLSDRDILKYGLKPLVVTCLPSQYASEEQKNIFYEIIRGYDKDIFYFGRFSKKEKRFLEGKEVNDYVLNDELMNSSGMKERK